MAVELNTRDLLRNILNKLPFSHTYFICNACPAKLLKIMQLFSCFWTIHAHGIPVLSWVAGSSCLVGRELTTLFQVLFFSNNSWSCFHSRYPDWLMSSVAPLRTNASASFVKVGTSSITSDGASGFTMPQHRHNRLTFSDVLLGAHYIHIYG